MRNIFYIYVYLKPQQYVIADSVKYVTLNEKRSNYLARFHQHTHTLSLLKVDPCPFLVHI